MQRFLPFFYLNRKEKPQLAKKDAVSQIFRLYGWICLPLHEAFGQFAKALTTQPNGSDDVAE